VVADAGTGLQAGVQAIQRRRSKDKPLTSGLDVFHLEMEARKPLGRLWRKVEALWLQAEKADKRAAQAEPDKVAGRLSSARAAWRRVQWHWEWYERFESGWNRLKAALELFRPDGQLNSRAWASAEIKAACKLLTGPRWAKVRRMAQDPRMLTFLDRAEVKLAQAEPGQEVRLALVELWRLERRQPQAAPALAVAQQAVCMKLAQDWQQAYARVSEVLSGVVRASSAAECVNSVLRMQQGRHRNVTQAMLDLKRLYWNCRPFEQGKRKDRCPYEHLGIALPTYDFWDLLNADPALLTQQLSSSDVTP